MPRWSSLFPVLPTVLLLGCVEPVEVETTAAAKGGCPLWGCASNSPVMGQYQFHELDADGAFNDADIRLLGLRQGSNTYRPYVDVDHLVAVDPTTGTVLQGAALTGAYFDLETLTGDHWQIHIKKVSTAVTHWIAPAAPVETYELLYTMPGSSATEMRPLCVNPPAREDGEGRVWGRQFEAVLFTGDRYDAKTKTVTAASYLAAGKWFNIGCAGGALVKLFLNRHATSSSTATHQSSAGQRQAMLKMYTGDFCGTGAAYTKQGTPLRWENTKKWTTLPISVASYESLWSSTGAVCLDEHRLGADWTDFINGMPGMFLGVCPKPKCSSLTGFPGSWPRGPYILTATPF